MKMKLMLVMGVVLLACQVSAEESLILKTQSDRENYTTGINIVRTLKQQGGVINLDIVIQGMKDELTGERHLLNDDTIRETMLALQSQLTKKQTCRVIEYTDHFKAICKDDLPKTPVSSLLAQTQVRTPVLDEEQTLRALVVASIAPPKGNAPPVPASSQAPVKVQIPVQQQTFAALLAAQEQAITDGDMKIELSALARRFGESWLKTQPH